MTAIARIDPATVEQLGPVLDALVAQHEHLVELAGEHRAALSAADGQSLGSVVEKTMSTLSRIAQLEERRCRLLGLPAPHLAGPAQAQPSLDEIAELCDESASQRIRASGSRLRELIERVRHEHTILRKAGESLASHMHGLMQQISANLSHAGTYSPSARVEASRQQIITGIDLTR